MPTWISTSSGRWTDSARWSGGVPNAAGAVATFNLAATTNLSATFLEGEVARVGTMNLTLGSGSSLTISGATGDTGLFNGNLTFDNGASAATLTVNRVDSSGVGLTFSDAGGFGVTLQSDLVITAITSQISFDASISGPGSLTHTGDSSLILRRANSFSGGLTVEGGSVSFFGDVALGSGAVTISNHGSLLSRTTTTVDNAISTLAGTSGAEGSARVNSAPGFTLTFTGVLSHLSGGELTFGSLTTNGDIIARFSQINDSAADGSFHLQAGKVTFGDAYNAANLLSFTGTGRTTIGAGGTLDTNGFATTISNLQLSGGAIQSGTGALNVTVQDATGGTIHSAGTVFGTAGADRFIVFVETYYALANVTFSGWDAADVIELNGNGAGNSLFGSTADEIIRGFDGDDRLYGIGGVDQIEAGEGDDLVFLNPNGAGSALHGGNGFDTLEALSAGIPILSGISLAEFTGFERIELNDMSLTFSGAQFDTNMQLGGFGGIRIIMDAANPELTTKTMSIDAGSIIVFHVIGSAAADRIKLHADTRSLVTGGEGSDVVQGSDQLDGIYGDDGIDKLAGNGGADKITGGAGADIFKYRRVTDSGLDDSVDPDEVLTIGSPPRQADWIQDFEIGIDKLNFRRIDTNPLVAGDQEFAFIGTAAFSATGAAQIRYADQGAHLRVEADVNGDGFADMYIRLFDSGGSTLSAADFVL